MKTTRRPKTTARTACISSWPATSAPLGPTMIPRRKLEIFGVRTVYWPSSPSVNAYTEKITKDFKYFPTLHRFLAACSNIIPPVITTGVGPDGRKVVHLQPPTQHRKIDDNTSIDESGDSPPHAAAASWIQSDRNSRFSNAASANARENLKLENDCSRLRMEEIRQIIELHKISVLNKEVLAEQIKIIEARYADTPKRARSRSPPKAGPSKRHH
ncbi:hypothetical protein K438DRAFT_1826196 [Mycena galopus ATCC 62051]|nr:hypothetical protein K438DRAFT_1826196 [Mycena galopus ATCC 62051]